MKINIFDQSTEAGKARLNIFELSTLTFGLASTSIGEFLSVIGIFPITPLGLGLPVCIATGLLAILCFMPLVMRVSRYSEIKKREDHRGTRQRKYSLPGSRRELLASSDTYIDASGFYDFSDSEEFSR